MQELGRAAPASLDVLEVLAGAPQGRDGFDIAADANGLQTDARAAVVPLAQRPLVAAAATAARSAVARGVGDGGRSFCCHCGRPFTDDGTSSSLRKYCNTRCQRRHNNRRSSAKRRERLAARDGRRCAYCLTGFGADLLGSTEDHVIRFGDQRSYALANLRLACLSCNMVREELFVNGNPDPTALDILGMYAGLLRALSGHWTPRGAPGPIRGRGCLAAVRWLQARELVQRRPGPRVGPAELREAWRLTDKGLAARSQLAGQGGDALLVIAPVCERCGSPLSPQASDRKRFCSERCRKGEAQRRYRRQRADAVP